MIGHYINVSSVDQVLQILSEKPGSTRIISGGTDLLLEIERGLRDEVTSLVDVSRIQGLDQITLDDAENIHLGPNVTHNTCARSKLLQAKAFPLALASWSVGSPQIRNRGTIAGNLITASPANDTISALMALNAKVLLKSKTETREVKLEDLYLGVRKTTLHPDEMLVDINFPALTETQQGVFIKQALRRAQAISVTNAAIVITFDHKVIKDCRISLGSVAPTIISAKQTQDFLIGNTLSDKVILEAGELAASECFPISDLRGSLDYRREMVKVSIIRGLNFLAGGSQDQLMPKEPVILQGKNPIKQGFLMEKKEFGKNSEINTTINGSRFSLYTDPNKSLLRLLREDAHLTGTKEGCAEGECGACTVFLDGMSVMSCLVPAARADGATIVTVEGIANNGDLHPVQKSFIDEGAVQCGYCTPGFIMSAVKLYEERERPTVEEIKTAISGNLCRCTGYYSIVQAIEKAYLKQ